MFTLEMIRSNREKFKTLIFDTSVEQLNQIPEGFNNNMVWNYGHTIISAYGLFFIRSGINPNYTIQFWDKYKKGSKPESVIDLDELTALKNLSDQFIHDAEKIVATGNTVTISHFSTITFGLEISNIQELMESILAHDILHYQVALDQKRMLKVQS